MGRSVEDPAQRDELPFKEQARVGREQVGDPFGRRVRAMRGPERVVHVEVEARSELPREGRIVSLFLRMEADVLQHQHIARLHRADSPLDAWPHRVVEKRDLAFDELGQALRDGRERELGVGPFGAPQVGDEPQRRAAFDERAESWERGTDPRVVRDLAFLERHIEVDAHEGALSADVGVPDRPLVKERRRVSGQRPPVRASSRRRTR